MEYKHCGAEQSILALLSIVLVLNFTNLIIDTQVDIDVLKTVTVLGRTWTSTDIHLLIPRTCKMYFADVTELRMLTWHIILDYHIRINVIIRV